MFEKTMIYIKEHSKEHKIEKLRDYIIEKVQKSINTNKLEQIIEILSEYENRTLKRDDK